MRQRFGIGRLMLVIVALAMACAVVRELWQFSRGNVQVRDLILAGAIPMTVAFLLGVATLRATRGRRAVHGFVIGQAVALLIFLGLVAVDPSTLHQFFPRLLSRAGLGPGLALVTAIALTILAMQSAVAFVGSQVAQILVMTGRIAPGPDAPEPR